MLNDEEIEHLKKRWKDDDFLKRVVQHLGATRDNDGAIGDLARLAGIREGRIDLRYIPIPDNTDLSDTKLNSIDFSYAEFNHVNLHQADLTNCLFESATFHGGSLRKAVMNGSTFRSALMYAVDIDPSDFAYVELDGALLANPAHREDPSNPRRIRMIYRQCGRYREAGKQYYKEMRAAKKQARHHKERRRYLSFLLSSWLFGYGERPWQILLYAIGVIFLYSMIYSYAFPGQMCYNSGNTDSEVSFTYMRSLYFSAITFATLGYGDWHPRPECTALQLLTSSEALVGLALVSIGIVSLARVLIRG
jgi:hypothetical protein